MKKLFFSMAAALLCMQCLQAQNPSPDGYKTTMSPAVPPSVVGQPPQPGRGTAAADGALLDFVNGSFEKNSGKCLINASNATITGHVAGVNAYGCANEIDLMNNNCNYGTAYQGQYFLALANGQKNCPDAATMELNMNLVAGNTYTIAYYDRGYDVNGCCPPGVPLEVGVATGAGQQGTVVYTSPVPTTNVWTQRTITFVAPNNGKYISFQAKYGWSRWTHIDALTISGEGSGGCTGATCNNAGGLAANNITDKSAQLSWSGDACVIGYFAEYRAKGTGRWTKAITRQNQLNIDNLAPATTYQWRLLTVCRAIPDSLKSLGFVYGPEFTTQSVPGVTAKKITVARQAAHFTATASPNPVSTIATIQVAGAGGPVQVVLTDAAGQTVWQSTKITTGRVVVDMSRLNPGVYMAIVTDQRSSQTIKLVKK